MVVSPVISTAPAPKKPSKKKKSQVHVPSIPLVRVEVPTSKQRRLREELGEIQTQHQALLERQDELLLSLQGEEAAEWQEKYGRVTEELEAERERTGFESESGGVRSGDRGRTEV